MSTESKAGLFRALIVVVVAAGIFALLASPSASGYQSPARWTLEAVYNWGQAKIDVVGAVPATSSYDIGDMVLVHVASTTASPAMTLLGLASEPGCLSNWVLVCGGASGTWPTPTVVVTGGDLDGESDDATVTGIQGRPVLASAPTLGQALLWNGSQWGPDDAGGSVTLAGDVTGDSGSNSVVKLRGRSLSSAVPSTDDVLTWDGATWAPAPVEGGGGGGEASASSWIDGGFFSAAGKEGALHTWLDDAGHIGAANGPDFYRGDSNGLVNLSTPATGDIKWIVRASSGRIVVGVEEEGFWVSADGGTTWEQETEYPAATSTTGVFLGGCWVAAYGGPAVYEGSDFSDLTTAWGAATTDGFGTGSDVHRIVPLAPNVSMTLVGSHAVWLANSGIMAGGSLDSVDPSVELFAGWATEPAVAAGCLSPAGGYIIAKVATGSTFDLVGITWDLHLPAALSAVRLGSGDGVTGIAHVGDGAFVRTMSTGGIAFSTDWGVTWRTTSTEITDPTTRVEVAGQKALVWADDGLGNTGLWVCDALRSRQGIRPTVGFFPLGGDPDESFVADSIDAFGTVSADTVEATGGGFVSASGSSGMTTDVVMPYEWGVSTMTFHFESGLLVGMEGPGFE